MYADGLRLQSSALSSSNALPSGWLRIQSTSGDLAPDVAALVGLRRLLAQVERDVEANERHSGGPLELSFGVGSEREYMFLMSPVAAKDTAKGWRLTPLRTVERGVTTVTQLKRVAEELTQRLNELAEMVELRLQMMMDRRRQVMETVSNLQNKIAEARQQIISNMSHGE